MKLIIQENNKFQISGVDIQDLRHIAQLLSILEDGILRNASKSKNEGMAEMRKTLIRAGREDLGMMNDIEFEEYYDNEMQISISLIKFLYFFKENGIV